MYRIKHVDRLNLHRYQSHDDIISVTLVTDPGKYRCPLHTKPLALAGSGWLQW